ncbi:MAG: translation initiation factor [Bacteroides sp.]|nr:translation initiation factor [Bacteroides sp.]
MDWKDALSNLKDSGSLPVDDTPEISNDMQEETIQKTPLHVVIDNKGRKGKSATIIEGFTGSDDKLQELARNLKQKLGTGGSARNGEILIQGNRRDDIMKFLKELGYKVK